MEKAMATHSSTLAWKIPWMEEPGRLQSMGSRRVRHSWATSLSLSCIGEGNGNPLQCSCLENPRDGGAWWAAVYGVAQSRTRLKRLSSSNSACEMPETTVRSQKGAKWGLQPPLPLGQEQSTVLNIFICKRVLWLKYWVGQKVRLRFSIMVYGDHCLLIETTVFIQAHYVANEETK